MNKAAIRKNFFDELEKGLPDVKGISIKSRPNRLFSAKVKIAFAAISSTALAAAAIAVVVSLGMNKAPSGETSPYYQDIISKLTAESQCARACPDFKRGLCNPNLNFYLVERNFAKDGDGVKVGLYLHSDKARQAEKDLSVSSLLNRSVFGGDVFYYGACKYLNDLETVEFPVLDGIPYKKGDLELVAVYYQVQYTVTEEITQSATYGRQGSYFQPFHVEYDGNTVLEYATSYSMQEVYESRIDLGSVSSESAFNPFFSSYDYAKIGNLIEGDFVYDASYYSPDKDYSVPELNEASELVSKTDFAASFKIPYSPFKKIMRSRADYYRVPHRLNATAELYEYPVGTLPEGTHKWLIESLDELMETPLNKDSLSEFNEAYFEGNSLVLLTQSGDSMSVGRRIFDHIDRRGDNLEIGLIQEKSYETRAYGDLWIIQVPKSSLEGKSPGEIVLNIDTIDPVDTDALRVFSNPWVGYGYRIESGGISDWELTSYAIGKREVNAPYDSSIDFSMELPFLPSESEASTLKIERLVREGNSIGVYMVVPESWNPSGEKHVSLNVYIDTFSDFIQSASEVRIISFTKGGNK